MSTPDSNHAIFVASIVVAGAVVALAMVGQVNSGLGFPLVLSVTIATMIGVGGVAGIAQKGLRAVPEMGRVDLGTLLRALVAGVGLSLAGSGALLLEQQLFPALGPTFAMKERFMAMLLGDGPVDLVVAVFAAAVVPAIIEEWLFRGVLRTYLKRHLGMLGRVVVLGVLFSLFHVDPTVLVPMVYVGVVLSICAERAGGWIAAIVAHFALNAFSIAVLSQLPIPETIWTGLAGVAVGGVVATWAVAGMQNAAETATN